MWLLRFWLVKLWILNAIMKKIREKTLDWLVKQLESRNLKLYGKILINRNNLKLNDFFIDTKIKIRLSLIEVQHNIFMVWIFCYRYHNQEEINPNDPSTPIGKRIRKLGKSTLSFVNLIESDSGTFSCVAKNMLGSVSKNFTLKVEDGSKHPVLPGGPQNTTAEIGESTYLQCQVN